MGYNPNHAENFSLKKAVMSAPDVAKEIAHSE